jgi:CRISPR-associated endonuclease/helicase Cas3
LQISQVIKSLLNKLKTEVDWDDFVNFIENKDYDEIFDNFSFDVLDYQFKSIDPDTQTSLFYLHQLIYSLVLFSDKNDVILKDSFNNIQQQDVSAKVDKFRENNNFNNPSTEINKLKNEAFFEAVKNLESVFKHNHHVYSVTLPTGLGKTITTFVLADKLRKLAGLKDSKIIINIPFTSIIDQNFEVYSDILQTNNSYKLLKHHHLAEPVYKSDENTASYDESIFLIETWQSDIIVTTFVQLLETILSCDKTKLMKFAHMANSVVLLDEIQTIPYEYWETVRKTFKIIGQRFNIYFILISATQPLIFTPNEDIYELVPNYKKYFRLFNRTKLIINHDRISFNKFKSILTEYTNVNHGKDILVILNTKDAALQVFEHLREELISEKTDICFLTTLITPFERKRIIDLIKEESKRQKIIISTQLVEAGVDISVDTVFRQIAPFDSIVQAAGRANRYKEKHKISEVFIYDIEELRKVSGLIYGSDLLLKTTNVLKEYNIVEEQDYLKLIEKYFKEVRKQSDQTSNKLLQAINNLEFAQVDFELIENRKSESVFVQLNTDAKRVWHRYLDIYSEEGLSPWERKEMFSEIKSVFYDFVINVPIPWGESAINFDSKKINNFYLSEIDNPSRFYSYSENDLSFNTGYNSKINTVIL